MAKKDPVREQVTALLRGGNAHLGFEDAIQGFPAKLRDVKPQGLPHSAWELLEHMRIAQAQGSHFADAQRDFHFGLDARSERWAAAAVSDPRSLAPVLNRDESDALFNFCWQGRIMPAQNSRTIHWKAPSPAGLGSLPVAPPNRP